MADRAGRGGFQHELIGPPSNYINLPAFLEHGKQTMPLWNGTAPAIISEPFKDLSEEELADLEARCSCEDIQSELQVYFDDDGLLTDIKLWQWARTHAGSDSPEKLAQAIVDGSTASKSRKAAAQAELARLAAANMNSLAESSVGEIVIDPSLDVHHPPPMPPIDTFGLTSIDPKTGRRRRDPPQATVEPSIRENIDPIREALLSSGLRQYQPFYEAFHYMRKTKQSDYQSLSQLRTSGPPTAFTDFESTDAAFEIWNAHGADPEVLVFVTFHPISHKVSSNQERADALTIPSRLQHVVMLGSQTLADLRDALVSSANGVPAERTEADDMQEVLLERDVSGDGGISTILSNGLRPRYVQRKWKGGCVVSIDNKLYADTRDGQQDYAQMIRNTMAVNDWPGPKLDQTRMVPVVEGDGRDIYVQGVDHTYKMASSAPEIDPTLMLDGMSSDHSIPIPQPPFEDALMTSTTRRVRPHRPDYQMSGKTMQETKLSELAHGMRLGEPNWLLQQGNDEHVFVFDAVRLLHATDPCPVLPRVMPPTSPYPITTFMSRVNVNKCAVCDRDPATRVTVNDELAGTTPCPMCDVCFQYLHGTINNALANGVEVIPVVEDLA